MRQNQFFLEGKNPIDSRDESKKMKTENQPSSASSNYIVKYIEITNFSQQIFDVTAYFIQVKNKFIPLNLKKKSDRQPSKNKTRYPINYLIL